MITKYIATTLLFHIQKSLDWLFLFVYAELLHRLCCEICNHQFLLCWTWYRHHQRIHCRSCNFIPFSDIKNFISWFFYVICRHSVEFQVGKFLDPTQYAESILEFEFCDVNVCQFMNLHKTGKSWETHVILLESSFTQPRARFIWPSAQHLTEVRNLKKYSANSVFNLIRLWKCVNLTLYCT